MHRMFKREQVLTIPNLLSLLRLLMIPLIIWLYCGQGNGYAAAAGVVLSGLTDVADGFIARKFGMVSDLGKILDPIADKLTQGALIFSLIIRYDWMLWLLILFVVKEVIMGVCGLIVIKKKDVVNSAQWFGKLSTAVLYFVMFLLFVFSGVPESVANGMILLCAAALMLSLVNYLRFYYNLLNDQER